MNKSSMIYRKCAFCPHHNGQAKCCCRKEKSKCQHKGKRAKSIRNVPNQQFKNRDGQMQNISSIDYVNNNNSRVYQNNSRVYDFYNLVSMPTIIAQNSILKTQNGNLKKQLLNVSNFNHHEQTYHKQYNSSIPTLNSYNKTPSQQQTLMDKLYYSNRNLQESIIKIQALSKQNHLLGQQNIRLTLKNEKMIVQLHKYQDQIGRLSKCSKKSHSQVQDKFNQVEQKYKYLQQVNFDLKKQLQKQKQKLSKLYINQQNCLSPQWIAQTSGKVKMIEKGLSKLEQTDNINTNADEQQNNSNSSALQINRIKQQLFMAISNAQSQTKKFHSSLLVQISSKADIMTIVKILIENIIQSVISSQMTMQHQLVRKIVSFQKKVDFLMGKLQNLVLSVRNRQLRKRSTSRSKISAKRNDLIKEHNSFSRNSIASKENFNNSNSANMLVNRTKSQFNY